jgi:alkylation response protein AidB-like acyl-CoA dehydrogenase
MLRAAVRELAEDKIAPRAAEIDETGEFPWDVYEALRANGFHAIHIPEQFGGQGATRWPPAWSSRRWPACAPRAR